jgi:hypothetical protein
MMGSVVVNCLVGKYSRDNVRDILCECISREEKCLFIIVDTNPLSFSLPFSLPSNSDDDRMTVMISAYHLTSHVPSFYGI